MKRLFYLIFLVSTLSNAQLTLHHVEVNSDINDGDVISINQDHFEQHIIITNNYSYDVNIRLVVTNIINTDGSELSMCFGIAGLGHCSYPTVVNEVFDGGAVLAAGVSTGNNDFDFTHIENNNFTTFPKDYVFKISALNTSDNSEISSITFTSRISSIASADEHIFDTNFSVFANAQKQLIVKTEDNVNFAMYNLTGQQVINKDLSAGTHRLSIAKLPAGIYMVYAKSGTKQIYKKVVIQ